MTAYLDARNVLNFKNVIQVFTQTNDVKNLDEEQNEFAASAVEVQDEATASGVAVAADGTVDLSFGGIADPRQGCGTWVTTDGVAAAPELRGVDPGGGALRQRRPPVRRHRAAPGLGRAVQHDPRNSKLHRRSPPYAGRSRGELLVCRAAGDADRCPGSLAGSGRRTLVFFLREDAMHSFLRMRNALWVGLCALALSAIAAGAAEAKPRPGNPNKGFRLFARPLGALVINRIYCGLSSDGEICVDSTNSSTIGGGFWPKGTADQYVFNSGIQVAGIIGPDANPEWPGDTTGAQFFSPRGDNVGEEFRPIFNASNPDDVANWPEAAKVPLGDASEELFNPLLRGRVSASQGDVWFLSWEGNPAFSAGREHPLGILVEQRGMGWNFPAGNEDILYFIYTFYNVTSKDPAAYAAVRPGMREILAEAGTRFQTINEARFGISIPDGGYTINNLFAAFGADMDVAEAGANFSSVNVPFSLGYVYEHTFSPAAGWTFDPSIFSPPFFSGSGFVGVKYLKSPVDPVTNQEVGLTLFSNTINDGAFDDAQTSPSCIATSPTTSA